MTKQRELVKNIVNSSFGHPTAEDIITEARKIMPDIAVGTVYRNLAMLTESGEIRKIEIPNAPSRFDRNYIYHEHLICSVCGEIKDVHLDGLKKYLEDNIKENIVSYNLTLYYICDKCKTENEVGK